MTNCKAEKEGSKNMSKVKDENYIHIPGWAVTRLGLKGNELLVYAIIYGFSQDGETRFTGSLQYLADWTNSTKQSCIKCLKSLAEKGYITKYEKIVNGVKFCEYQAVKPKSMVVNKVEQGSKQRLTGGSKQSLPNILDNNILDNNTVSNIGENNNTPKTEKTPKSEKKEKFKAPSVEEVQEYCTERGNNIDAQHFIDYYSARGWMLGKNHIKDWKACIRTWERNDSFKPQKSVQPLKKYDQNGYESEEELMKMFYGK